MKKLTSLAALAALTISLLSTGCANNTAQQQAIEQLLITTAATAGTEAALNPQEGGNPSLRPDFVAVDTLLYALSGNTNQLTVAQVQAVLASAGQTNAAIAPLVPLVVNLVNVYSQTAQGTNGAVLSGTTQQVVLWIANGIQADLSLNAPPASVKYGRIFKPVMIKK